MTITFHNTLTGQREEFKTLDGNTVTMYVCGVTPYDEVHLGHARAYVTFDIVRRHLERSGYQVRYVQNFTDVDDKIIRRAAERGVSPRELADRYIRDYFEQMDRLNIKRADGYPRVMDSIPEIVAFIETLIKKGFAYVVDGDVYYAVRKFPGYGKLSKRSIEDLQSGARVEIGEHKKDPLDFALWKRSKPGEPADVSWKSPWGMGRPGWHIECSVMSTNCLGKTIDIHGGGMDLIFPHHENEIAQSEAATGKLFARYWIHNGFVTVNQEKMSKSLGNFFTLREIFEKFPPRTVRYFLLSQHYRSPLDFSDDKLKAAGSAIEGLDEAWQKLFQQTRGVPDTDAIPAAPETFDRFRASLDDDFNTEKALSVLHEFKRDILSSIHGKDPRKLRGELDAFALMFQEYLGIPLPSAQAVPAEVVALKAEREQARKDRNWPQADALRRQLDSLGYRVEDNPDGSSTLLRKTA